MTRGLDANHHLIALAAAALEEVAADYRRKGIGHTPAHGELCDTADQLIMFAYHHGGRDDQRGILAAERLNVLAYSERLRRMEAAGEAETEWPSSE